MIPPRISPLSEGPQPLRGRPPTRRDDLEIPPFPELDRLVLPSRSQTRADGPSPTQRRFQGLRAWGRGLATAGLLASLAAGVWCLSEAGRSETSHANWNHVLAAGQAGGNRLVHVDASGNAGPVVAVALSRADIDRETTDLVRAALANNDLVAAEAAFRAAQPPGLISKTDSPGLASDANLLNAIRDGRAEFFHLRVSDSCAEDNDILHVSVNGVALGEAPLTHSGMVFSIPVIPGMTVIRLLGVRDGGGGITMKFESSEGHYFSRSMQVGEECIAWVAIQ